MNHMSLRPILAPLAGAVLCFALTQGPRAANDDAVVAHYAARARSVTDGGYAGRIDLLIDRWSTEEDIANVRDLVAHGGADRLLPLLQQARTRVGVLLMPGVQGTGARARTRRPRNLVFARQIETKEGRQVVVVADQHLGLGEFERWGPSSEEEFTLIDLRIGKDGVGVAKVAPATGIAYNKETKMIEVADYKNVPVRLTDVRAEGLRVAEAPERAAPAKQYR
jgi:hypothetical protein